MILHVSFQVGKTTAKAKVIDGPYRDGFAGSHKCFLKFKTLKDKPHNGRQEFQSDNLPNILNDDSHSQLSQQWNWLKNSTVVRYLQSVGKSQKAERYILT